MRTKSKQGPRKVYSVRLSNEEIRVLNTRGFTLTEALRYMIRGFRYSAWDYAEGKKQKRKAR